MRAFRINDRRGFTLVELMEVVMILGLMITLTAANWRRIVPRAQLNAAVRSLSNVLNGTRSEAIARNAEFRVLYDLDNEAYWVETPYKKTGGLAAERIPGEPDPEEDLRGKIDFKELGDGVTFTSIKIDGEDYVDGQVYVRFTPGGSSSEHTIELLHAATNTSYTIEVLALTGLIRFHEGSFEREEVSEEDFR